MFCIASDESKAENLLSEPCPMETATRSLDVKYENLGARFLRKDRSFNKQYAHLYAERLFSTRVRLESRVKEKWTDVQITRLADLKTEKRCVIIGTLYKDMQLKPSILKKITEDAGMAAVPVKERFTDASDFLVLEDELQRIALTGAVDVQRSVTGCVVALLGREREEALGKFAVEDVLYPSAAAPPAWPELQQDRYVVFVSGLELGGASDDLMTQQLLVDFLCGSSGGEELQQAVSNIARVVVAGNSLRERRGGQEQKARHPGRKAVVETVQGVKLMDDFLAQLAGAAAVSVMAGETDAANMTLPQQPLQRCMFPQASHFPTLHTPTNPHHFSLDGVSILGSSGQPVNDVTCCSSLDNPLDVMERMLTWGHMAPTAPDTLACYPYYDQDPFILGEAPHVFFTANTETFAARTVSVGGREVVLLAVPRFSTTTTAVILNLRTRDVTPVSFSCVFGETPEPSSGGPDK